MLHPLQHDRGGKLFSVEYIREILSAIILLTPAIHCDCNPNLLLIMRPHKIRCKALAFSDFVAAFRVQDLVVLLSVQLRTTGNSVLKSVGLVDNATSIAAKFTISVTNSRILMETSWSVRWSRTSTV